MREVDWGGGVTFAHTRAQEGSTALILAAINGHAECARLLLDAGADTNAKDMVRASAGGGVRGVLELWWRLIGVCGCMPFAFVFSDLLSDIVSI